MRLGGGEVVSLDRAEAIIWADDRPADLRAVLHRGIKWVQLSSAGIEDWLAAGVIDDRRRWTAATGVYARPIAEYLIAAILAAARRLPLHVNSRNWKSLEAQTLDGATVGIIGAGGIGSALIKLLQPFDARTIAVTRTGRRVPGADTSLGPDDIDIVVAASDFLVLAAPDTGATRGMLGAARLAKMRPDAWLINVGRGTAVDTAALVAALERGQIGGAILDVTDPEPLPDDHPLWRLPNAVITAHTASTPALGAKALTDRVEENVRRFRSGEPLLGQIELSRGY